MLQPVVTGFYTTFYTLGHRVLVPTKTFGSMAIIRHWFLYITKVRNYYYKESSTNSINNNLIMVTIIIYNIISFKSLPERKQNRDPPRI